VLSALNTRPVGYRTFSTSGHPPSPATPVGFLPGSLARQREDARRVVRHAWHPRSVPSGRRPPQQRVEIPDRRLQPILQRHPRRPSEPRLGQADVGLRCLGSSCGNASWTSAEREPVNSMMVSANAIMLNAPGLPRFTGPVRSSGPGDNPATKSPKRWIYGFSAILTWSRIRLAQSMASNASDKCGSAVAPG
jgi:hypothetical protein